MIKKGFYLGLGISLLLTGCDLIEYHPYDVRIDGETGINVKNIRAVMDAGADTFVAGSAIFTAPDYAAVINLMRREMAD